MIRQFSKGFRWYRSTSSFALYAVSVLLATLTVAVNIGGIICGVLGFVGIIGQDYGNGGLAYNFVEQSLAAQRPAEMQRDTQGGAIWPASTKTMKEPIPVTPVKSEDVDVEALGSQRKGTSASHRKRLLMKSQEEPQSKLGFE